MTTSFKPLQLRQRLNQLTGLRWSPPSEHGPDGWFYLYGAKSVIVSCAEHDGAEWVHASIASQTRLPSYSELKELHAAVFGGGWAYQVFAPPSDHVNIHEFALHLWGRLDGRPALPDFTAGSGSI